MRVLLDTNVIVSAINGKADMLVTGDKEVVSLERVGGLRTLTPCQFWEFCNR